MGGLFDDIFDDGDFEIASEEEIDDAPDDWNDGPDRQRGATWDTGRQPDIWNALKIRTQTGWPPLWNADEPWTTSDDSCDRECDPVDDYGDCQDNTAKQDNFKVDDFFS